MNHARSILHCATLASGALALGLALPAAAEEAVGADATHLVYLPSRAAGVDHLALIDAFGERGFTVHTLAFAGESDAGYARRIAKHVRALMREGVPPERITVVGAGSGSPVAALTSAATGHRRVNYVLLGQCDRTLRDEYRFRMSGRVLGMRADSDDSSHSCRPLWQDAPKVGERRDFVIASPLGARLFDQPREEWMQPLARWSQGGRVTVGEVRVGMATPRPRSPLAAR